MSCCTEFLLLNFKKVPWNICHGTAEASSGVYADTAKIHSLRRDQTMSLLGFVQGSLKKIDVEILIYKRYWYLWKRILCLFVIETVLLCSPG